MIDYAQARRAMVDCQVRPSDVTSYAIIEAMSWAPRELFVPRAKRDVAYAGAEIEVAPGRMLLDPRCFAKMLEAAQIGRDDLVLDLAPATGYSTAVLSRLAEAVVAIEADASLVVGAQALLNQLEVVNAAVSGGEPAAGDAPHGPYDAILINGAVERVPDELLAQLKDGGRLVAVFGAGQAGQCRVVVRAGDALTESYEFDANAPLIAGFEAEEAFTF